MRDITLGQFIPGNSCIHKLDPRTKILLMVAYIVLVFLIKDLVLFVIPLVFIISVLWLARISMSYLFSSLRPIRWLLIFMFVLNLFMIKGETVYFSWWIFSVSRESLFQAVFITLRLVFLVTGTSLMTLTTSPIALTDGLEKLMSPLKIIHFPAHELAMMMTIALRFIPTLMEEADKIKKAQMARGADFESGNLLARAKAMIPILVPLFVSSFRRADELAMAMESRCYHGGDGRTRMHELRLHWSDLVATIIMGMMIAAILLIHNFVPGLI